MSGPQQLIRVPYELLHGISDKDLSLTSYLSSRLGVGEPGLSFQVHRIKGSTYSISLSCLILLWKLQVYGPN